MIKKREQSGSWHYKVVENKLSYYSTGKSNFTALNMKNTARNNYIIAFLLISVVLGGCGIFKKKCDCPSFGFKKRDHPELPTTVNTGVQAVPDDKNHLYHQ